MRTLQTSAILAALLASSLAAADSMTRTQLSDEEAFGRTETQAPATEMDINHPYSQMVTLQIGPYTPRSIAFTNWNNNSFNYSDESRATFMAELGWSASLFSVGHFTFYFSESLAYSTMTLKLPPNLFPQVGAGSVTLHMFGFDTRLTQALDIPSLPRLTPFWEGGVQYTLYNQTGTSDLVGGEGGASNFVAGLGIRYWINRGSSVSREFPGRYTDLPVFVTAKLNEIFSNNSGFDPGSTSVLAGLSVGL